MPELRPAWELRLAQNSIKFILHSVQQGKHYTVEFSESESEKYLRIPEIIREYVKNRLGCSVEEFLKLPDLNLQILAIIEKQRSIELMEAM